MDAEGMVSYEEGEYSFPTVLRLPRNQGPDIVILAF